MKIWAMSALAVVFLAGGALHAQGMPVETLKPMAADADPSFAVATIKLSNATGMTLNSQQGEHYMARNVTLLDVVKFAYQLSPQQVVGMPGWATQDRYEIAAVMQPEGKPSTDQVRTMLKKLMVERFKLAVHTEQRMMPTFVLTVDKGGPKMKAGDGIHSGDVVHETATGIELNVRGTTAAGYCGYLQQVVLNRPVVDQTGLSGKYDFDVTFMPDETMFGGRMRQPTEGTVTAASLYTALAEIGLKLTPEKTATDVVVIDQAEKPTAN